MSVSERSDAAITPSQLPALLPPALPFSYMTSIIALPRSITARFCLRLGLRRLLLWLDEGGRLEPTDAGGDVPEKPRTTRKHTDGAALTHRPISRAFHCCSCCHEPLSACNVKQWLRLLFNTWTRRLVWSAALTARVCWQTLLLRPVQLSLCSRDRLHVALLIKKWKCYLK